MTDTEYRLAMDAIGFAAQIVTAHSDTYGALVHAERSMHSHLHITDPTLYMRAARDRGVQQQVRLAKATLAFIREVQAVKDEIQPREETTS